MDALPKTNIKAVHDEDLENVLETLGLTSKIRRHEITCNFCGTVITYDNLHSFFPLSGDIKFTCDNPQCIDGLERLLREGEISL